MPRRKTYPSGFKLLNVIKGHSAAVNRIAWSPTGRAIASTSNDATVRIWEATTAKPLRVFSAAGAQLNTVPTQKLLLDPPADDPEKSWIMTYSLAWSPDGSTIASGSEDRHLRVWNVQTGQQLWKTALEKASIGDLDWSPNAKIIAAGCSDNTVRLFGAKTGKLIRELVDHSEAVPTVAWSPNGRRLATGSWDRTILLWDCSTWKPLFRLEGHSDEIWDLAWSPTGQIIASASTDRTVALWDAEKGRQIIVLEGHTHSVKAVSFSADGNFIASKGADAVRIWRVDNHQMIGEIREQSPDPTFVGLSFHPDVPILATLSAKNQSIRIWSLDVKRLIGEARIIKTARYSNAKVVLVGDTGVGKSGLALVLTGKPWMPTDSTHGRRVWVFDSHETENPEGLKETREVLLWDLAGQPDYRLIHQLHLTEVAVALIVFDSRSQTDPFSGVRHWDRALRQAQRVQSEALPNTRKFLVSARADVGRIGVSQARVETLKQDLNLDGYFETSAKEGWGITELRDEIHKTIDWNALPVVSSSELFQSIKSFLVEEKESGRVLSPLDDLYRAYLNRIKNTDAPEDLRSQFETCIGRVESRGLIHLLSFGNLVLLQPELQDLYASAIANAVKDEPDGLGCIKEEKARAGEFRIPDTERLSDLAQEKLLLISTVEDLLRHEIALREQGEDGQYLVFPSQLTRENPDLPDPEGKAVIFTFEGPVLNIYATLAVRLSYSGVFTKKEMWKNAATYSAAVGGTCGMFLREVNEGRGELTLFFDFSASEEVRFQFEEYIRIHLQRRSLPQSINRRRVFACSECGITVSDLAAKRRRERGFDWIACNVCDPPTRISLLDREDRLIRPQRESKIPEMDRAADSQRKVETAASILQGKIATKDFDVFLCHNSDDKPEVRRIGTQLKERGILPWLDEWELRPGLPWQQLLEQQIERIKSAAVFVGMEGVGPWQQQELDALLREFVRRGCPIIPVILANAIKKPSLPIFLRGMTWVDFRQKTPHPLGQLIWGITGENDSWGVSSLPIR